MKPLNRIKVLIPRPINQADDFSNKILELGGEPIIFPLIEVNPINQDKLKNTHAEQRFNWIIFTSSVAVRFFFDVINPNAVTAKIAVVGTSTKKEVEKLGLKVNFTPSAATAKKLVKEIPLNKGEKVLIPRSKIAGKSIIETLTSRGMKVTEVATYNNTPVEYSKEEVEAVFNKNLNVITFTSASTVTNFVSLLRKHKIKLAHQQLVSIGPSTTAAAKKLHINIDKTAETHNVEGLIEAIESMYK